MNIDTDISTLRLLSPVITPALPRSKEYDKSLFGDRQSWRDFATPLCANMSETPTPQ